MTMIARSPPRLTSTTRPSHPRRSPSVPRRILPQPGEEAAWFEHNRAHLSALAPDGIKGL
jgi:hypothetical protein